ncbi:HAD family hydrolase [Phenylobacterium kunshanense]|uniref:HAD family hydrolase n=1 Tax=Phenylobacterium kunshanense TaxID=1445034 RepID=A0A328BNN1_9CAUL|nr:HAD family hydrolase [Phenylobacterium kunshanense]RAK68693.1 HAD family hydrolase [Phenylobacterium kunshanense]
MMQPVPRALLVDLDDTIIAAGERPIILRQVADELSGELGPHSPEVVAGRLEAALESFWSDPSRHRVARFGIPAARRQVAREAFAEIGLPTDLADRYAERFSELRDTNTVCFPGAIAGLEAIRTHGVKLALVTNGSAATQRAKVERFALAPYFDHIQIEGEVGFGKPEEAAYRHAMQALDAAPHETWIVGDNLEWEVAAPQRLGIRAIWCDGFRRGLPPNPRATPDHIVTSLEEIADLFAPPGR